MLTKKAIKIFGKKLFGRIIRTEKMGDWPGGLAKVILVYPDKKLDPEVPLWVRNLDGRGEIGIIDHEEIEIVG